MRSSLGCLVQGLCGLRCRLLFLVLIACTPLIVLTVHKAGEDRRRQASNWRQRTVRLTQQAQREEEKIIGQTKQLLLAIAESAHVRAGDQRNTKKLMNDLFASYPRYANLGVFRPNGEVLASALPLEPALTNMPCFRRALKTKTFAVGSLTTIYPENAVSISRDRSDQPSSGALTKAASKLIAPSTSGPLAEVTGATNSVITPAPATPSRLPARAIISFGHPVFGNSGQVEGVVFATLDWSWYSRFGSELAGQIPRNSTWTEINRSNHILVRYPNPQKWIGAPFDDVLPTAQLVERNRGIIEKAAAGTNLVYGIAKRSSQFVSGPVTTVLSIPREHLFAEADQTLRTTLHWSALALAVAVTLGWIGANLLVMRPVRVLAESSGKLARGDLHARTGLPHSRDELGELTLAFDQMAQALEQREIEKQRARDKLQVLSHRLVEVQETERRQIARELHDEVGQTLTVAEMHLQSALEKAESPAMEEHLVESIQAVEQVQDQVRNLSLNLRPSMLDDLGLEPALRWYTNRSATAAKIDCAFRADPLEKRLEPIIETECFRVGQEALTNVTRHSGASRVQVELRCDSQQLHLRVKDDGIGFDVGEVRDRAVRGSSLGLLSMEERATLAGGGLQILSAPGRGTEVHAWFPLKYRKETPEI